ncbi:MAG: dihydroneopterin aldolase, partial [Endozoicomonadaceae bacterium]|nr:dihydroneopterin aldolase [Endozoicomonadaceae bacterium]
MNHHEISADSVILENLQINTIIGVNEEERLAPQPLIITASLQTSFNQAMKSDALMDTLDYKTISEGMIQCCQANQSQLLEHLAYTLFVYLFSTWPIQSALLHIKKPQALPNSLASIRCY